MSLLHAIELSITRANVKPSSRCFEMCTGGGASSGHPIPETRKRISSGISRGHIESMVLDFCQLIERNPWVRSDGFGFLAESRGI